MNLSALVGMSSPAASHHLRQLKDSGLIVSRRGGGEGRPTAGYQRLGMRAGLDGIGRSSACVDGGA